ncbi:hypothetical protein ACF0H5_007390 [Mactra antiquata]
MIKLLIKIVEEKQTRRSTNNMLSSIFIRLSLLAISLVEGTHTNTSMVTKTRKYEYIGCYEYKTIDKSFNVTILRVNSRQKCQEYCGPTYKYVGTELLKCYCGNYVFGKLVEGYKCSWKCLDTNVYLQFCGGPYRVSMYKARDLKTTTTATTTTATLTTTMTSELSNSSDYNNSTHTSTDNGASLNYIVWVVVILVTFFVIIGFVLIIHCKIPRSLARASVQPIVHVHATMQEPSTSNNIADNVIQLNDMNQAPGNMYNRSITINSPHCNTADACRIYDNDTYDTLNYNQ